MTTPSNPYPSGRPDAQADSASLGDVRAQDELFCSRPSLLRGKSPSRAPVSLAAAMRSCEFLQSGDRSRPDDAAPQEDTARVVRKAPSEETVSDGAMDLEKSAGLSNTKRPDAAGDHAALPDRAWQLGDTGRSNGVGRGGAAQPDSAMRTNPDAPLDETARLDGAGRLGDVAESDGAGRPDHGTLMGATARPDDLARLNDTGAGADDTVRRRDTVPTADIDQSGAAVISDDTERFGDSAWTGFSAADERGEFGTADHGRTLVFADQAPPFDADAPDCAVCVEEPGEIISAVPAMIGFPPERSLVVLVLRSVPGRGAGAIIDAVVRFDLEQDGGRRRLRAGMVAQCILQICAHDDVAEVLAVVVDDRAVEPERRGSETEEWCGAGRFEVLIDALDRRLASHDIDLAGAWAVTAIEPEQNWWSLVGPDRRGALPDPATSAVTLSNVLDGRQIRGSRAELTALVAVDVEVRDQVAAVLDSALSVARDRYARAVRRGDPSDYSRQALDYVLWQIANTESGVQLMVPELAELAAALRDRAVRDAMFALAVGDHAVAAEGLWAALTRALTGRDRAEAAALLGYSAYVRGDGPLAGIALEAAMDADPDHPMAALLETSLMIGMRPDKLRRLARSGYDTAADLGVDLDSPTL
ncbi:DUF4192 domain-containing protein [Nocardia sp. NPDC051052]|uniref:DUF4192 domain-containing protein n=1 Tax=Nocardia sp. NPDC051052 TaxID=3364322 RepID=UPI0037B19A46